MLKTYKLLTKNDPNYAICLSSIRILIMGLIFTTWKLDFISKKHFSLFDYELILVK